MQLIIASSNLYFTPKFFRLFTEGIKIAFMHSQYCIGSYAVARNDWYKATLSYCSLKENI